MTTAKTSSDAVKKNADDSRHIYERALGHHRQGRLADAVKDYGLALRLSPNNAEIYNNLGVALRALGRPEAAIACYRRSLAQNPDAAPVYTNLGNALRDLGDFIRAVEAHRRAIKYAPNSPKVLFNAGRALCDVDQSKMAIDYFSRALKNQPNFLQARVEQAMALLRIGDWDQGLKELDARLAIPDNDPRRPDIPTWDGSPLKNKTILINHEGDERTQIQFLRFARSLKKMGAKVQIECPAHFNHLFSTSMFVDATPNVGAPVHDVDVQIPMLSLLARLAVEMDQIPGTSGYLDVPKFGGLTLNIPADINLVVGLAWSGSWGGRAPGGAIHPGDVKLDDLVELFGISGIQLVSLELGQGAGDIGRLGLQPLIEQAGSSIMDVADLAGIIDQLDLVICVDSVAAHVAGAMGKPIWMLTRPGAQWSWLMDRDDTPWYDSMRLFRKRPDQDWTSVVSIMRQALMNVLKGAD